MTQCGEDDSGRSGLVIPNKEVQWIFVQKIRKWFKEETKKDIPKLENFCKAFQKNDVTAIEDGFTSYLRKTISIRDSHIRKDMKETVFYMYKKHQGLKP